MTPPDEQHYSDPKRHGWWFVYKPRHNSVRTGLMSKVEAERYAASNTFSPPLKIKRHPNAPKWWQFWRKA